jgi:hypothetical protein
MTVRTCIENSYSLRPVHTTDADADVDWFFWTSTHDLRPRLRNSPSLSDVDRCESSFNLRPKRLSAQNSDVDQINLRPDDEADVDWSVALFNLFPFKFSWIMPHAKVPQILLLIPQVDWDLN